MYSQARICEPRKLVLFAAIVYTIAYGLLCYKQRTDLVAEDGNRHNWVSMLLLRDRF